MNKIKEIEKLLAKWEAAGERAFKNKASGLGEVYVNRVYGLKAALDIFKRPPNQVVEDGRTEKWTCKKCRFPQAGCGHDCIYCGAACHLT